MRDSTVSRTSSMSQSSSQSSSHPSSAPSSATIVPPPPNATVVAHSLVHKYAWDRLPVGTLYDIARWASSTQTELDSINPTLFRKLVGLTNVDGTSKFREFFHLEAISPAERHIAAELDWEAEEIAKDSGEMMGWRDTGGTRYGGTIQLAAILSMDGEGSSSVSTSFPAGARLTLQKPVVKGSCIFSRVFGSHRLLRVRKTKYIANWAIANSNNQRLLREYFKRPIYILGRKYQHLVEKDGVVIYFQEGIDLVGRAAERATGKKYATYGAGKIVQDTQGFINWWIPLEYNQQPFSKLITRLHLGLSDTIPGVFIHPDHIEVKPDIGQYNSSLDPRQ